MSELVMLAAWQRHSPYIHIFRNNSIKVEKYFPFKILWRLADFYTSKLDFEVRNIMWTELHTHTRMHTGWTDADRIARLVCNQCELNMCIYLQMIMVAAAATTAAAAKKTTKAY